MAIYAIGDIQGCYDSLQALVKKLPLQARDEIWICGDLVNRGPKSNEVLRWAMADSRVVAVLGNHDLHLLCAVEGNGFKRASDTFEDVLEAPDRDDLLAWLRSQPLLHQAHGFVMVHAGLHPLWSIELARQLAAECALAIREHRWLQAWNDSRKEVPIWTHELRGTQRLAAALGTLVGIRTIDDSHRMNTRFKGPPEERPAGCVPWFEHGQDNDETIVFGHWAALGLYLSPKHIGLDTGCVWGNSLTAIRLEDRCVFQQAALE